MGDRGFCILGDAMNKNKRVNDLKKHVFFELLSETGRVMILVKNSPDVVIGKRGFVGDEKKAGLTLVFNEQMKFFWDDYGITAKLTFGESSQKCFIPAGSIAAVYSPEVRVQLFTVVDENSAQTGQSGADTGDEDIDDSGQNSGNVINVDFVHRKRIKKEEAETEDS
jgi:hypothetical protein